MTLKVGKFLFLSFLLTVAQVEQRPSPFLRHTNYIALLGKQGQEVEMTLACVGHGTRYEDILRYAVVDSRSEEVLKGVVGLGESRTLRFLPRTQGLYVIELNSGWNCCVLRDADVPWAIVVSDRLRLQTVREIQKLYFYVPKGVTGFSLFAQSDVTGEGARIVVSGPSGATVCEQEGDFDRMTRLKIKVGAGQSGTAWSLAVSRPAIKGLSLDDVVLYFDKNIPPYVTISAEWAIMFGRRIAK